MSASNTLCDGRLLDDESLRERRQAFINKLPLIRSEAIDLGFYATANGPLHEAVQKIGYEFAELLEKGD